MIGSDCVDWKKKELNFFIFPDLGNLVTYTLMEIFLWNQMKAKILEHEF